MTGPASGLLRDAQGRTVESFEPGMILYRRGMGSVEVVMLAFAMMAIIRNKANAVAATPKKTPARRMPPPPASSAGRSRKSGA